MADRFIPKQKAHTGTPWWLEAVSVAANGNRRVMGAACTPVAIVPEGQSADGDLIVRAVNSHGHLLAACKSALAYVTELGLCKDDEEPAASLIKAIQQAEGGGDGKV